MKKDTEIRNSLGKTKKEMDEIYPNKEREKTTLEIRRANPHIHWLENGKCKICSLQTGTN